MWIRYKRTYSKESNEWGDFQVHRKALGLISIGRCSNDKEFEELFDNYKKEKENFADTLYNSRLLVFGMNSDGSPLTDDQKQDQGDLSPAPSFKIDSEKGSNCSFGENMDLEENDNRSNNGHAVPLPEMMDPLRNSDSLIKSVNNNETICDSNKTDSLTSKKTSEHSSGSQITFIRQKSDKETDKKKEKQKVIDRKKEDLKTTVKRVGSNSSMRDMSGSEVVFYPNVDNCDDLEDSVKEFVTSLFFVLEGKVFKLPPLKCLG